MPNTKVITLPEESHYVNDDITLIEWYIKPGDIIEAEQLVADIDTDKATIEITSNFSGKVVEINARQGEKIKVGQTLATIDTSYTESTPKKDTVGQKTIKYLMDGFVGEVRQYAGKNIPKNWHICDGSEFRKDEFPDLFNVIRSQFGENKIYYFKIPAIPPLNGVKHIICVKGATAV